MSKSATFEEEQHAPICRLPRHHKGVCGATTSKIIRCDDCKRKRCMGFKACGCLCHAIIRKESK